MSRRMRPCVSGTKNRGHKTERTGRIGPCVSGVGNGCRIQTRKAVQGLECKLHQSQMRYGITVRSSWVLQRGHLPGSRHGSILCVPDFGQRRLKWTQRNFFARLTKSRFCNELASGIFSCTVNSLGRSWLSDEPGCCGSTATRTRVGTSCNALQS